MKTYKLQCQNWISEKPLTAEQKQEIRESKGKAKITREYELAETETQTQLNAIWDAQKPTDDNYTLIDASVTLDDAGNFRGIVNYRVKGEHLQKRIC